MMAHVRWWTEPRSGRKITEMHEYLPYTSLRRQTQSQLQGDGVLPEWMTLNCPLLAPDRHQLRGKSACSPTLDSDHDDQVLVPQEEIPSCSGWGRSVLLGEQVLENRRAEEAAEANTTS